MACFAAPDGAQIFYADNGEGTPVLALAGLTRTHRDFDYLAPHLPDIRLIRMDYRGRGQSEWTGPASYTIPTEADDAIALLDHLGIEKAAILGTSRGGLIAMLLATIARHRLLGACLVDIGPVIEADGLADINAYLGRNPSSNSFEDAACMRAGLMKGFEGVPASRWAEEVRKHYRATGDGSEITYDPKLRDAVQAAGAAPAADFWPLFDALHGLPLALIRGANSNILSSKTADDMARRRPDMIRVEVPDRGHVPFLDEPEALKGIREWLQNLR